MILHLNLEGINKYGTNLYLAEIIQRQFWIFSDNYYINAFYRHIALDPSKTVSPPLQNRNKVVYTLMYSYTSLYEIHSTKV